MRCREVCKRVGLGLGVVLVTCTGASQAVFATPPSSSSSYQLTESQFNSGNSLESCSGGGQYCARVAIGDSTIGDSASASGTRATFGTVTPDIPTLEVIVEPGVSTLGTLDSAHTATKTMVVRIRNYLINGYTLQVVGTPPTYGGHTLTAMTSRAAAVAGREQFGINVVANSSLSTGADPVQVPDGSTVFGSAVGDYGHANEFKYVSGDVIGQSNISNGRTDYTITMVVNIANSTPAGLYASDFSAVVIPTY